MQLSLDVLFPRYLDSPSYSAYAASDVEYLPGATLESNPATVLLREKHPDGRGRRWVASVDMSLYLVRSAP